MMIRYNHRFYSYVAMQLPWILIRVLFLNTLEMYDLVLFNRNKKFHKVFV
jgi:hypothetical protein